MLRIYYYGDDDKIYGPVTEKDAQTWYNQAFLYSDVRFQISRADKADPSGTWTTLGQLIEQNGQFTPFALLPDRAKRKKEQEEAFNQMKKEVESMRKSLKEAQAKSDEKIVQQYRQIASLQEEMKTMREAFTEALCKTESTVLSKASELVTKKDNSLEKKMEKKIADLKGKVDEQDKNIASLRKEIKEVGEKCKQNDLRLAKFIEDMHRILSAREDCTRQSIDQLRTDHHLEVDRINEKCAQTLKNLIKVMNEHDEFRSTGVILAESVDNAHRKVDEVSKLQTVHESSITELKDKVFALENSEDSTRSNRNTLEEAQQDFATASQPGSLDNPAVAIPPWEKTKNTADAATKAQEAEQAPWEKDTKQAKPVEVPATKQKDITVTKPVPRVKDWDAICRDLSDDEEEEIKIDESTIDLPRNALAKSIVTFVHDFEEILNIYCTALDADFLDPIKAVKGTFDLDSMEVFYPSPALAPGTDAHIYVRETLLKEMRRLVSTTVVCSACNFQIILPRHMYLHFAQKQHVQRATEIGDDFTKISDLIASVLMYFFDKAEMERSMDSEEAALLRDHKRFEENISKFTVPSRYRPLPQFMDLIVSQVTSFTATAKNQYNRPTMPIAPGQIGVKKKEVIGKMRAWLAEEKNRKMLTELVESHLEEGIPMCSCCAAVFENAEEYYQHMTSYSHAMRDQAMFATIFWLWKGGAYWNGMM